MRFSDTTLDRFEWQQRALCKNRDPGDFFPEARPKVGPKQLCEGCPVAQECLDFALETGAVGIWGGTGTKQRMAMARTDHAALPDRTSVEQVHHWLAS